MKTIDEPTIGRLACVTQIVKQVEMSRGVAADPAVIQRVAPQLTWVLRDFQSRFKPPETKESYFERVMRPQKRTPGMPGDVEQGIETRAAINLFFPTKTLCTIVQPTIDEEELAHLEDLKYASLRVEFRAQMEATVREVLDCNAKSVLDPRGGANVSVPLTPHMIAAYVETMTAAYAAGGVPDFGSLWDVATRFACENAIREAMSELERAAIVVKKRFPLHPAALVESWQPASTAAVSLFERLASGSKADDARGQLLAAMKQLTDRLALENMAVSEERCRAAADEAIAEIKTASESSVDYDAYEVMLNETIARIGVAMDSLGPGKGVAQAAAFETLAKHSEGVRARLSVPAADFEAAMAREKAMEDVAKAQAVAEAVAAKAERDLASAAEAYKLQLHSLEAQQNVMNTRNAEQLASNTAAQLAYERQIADLKAHEDTERARMTEEFKDNLSAFQKESNEKVADQAAKQEKSMTDLRKKMEQTNLDLAAARELAERNPCCIL